MSAPTTARLALAAWRNDDAFEVPIRVIGLDLTDLSLAMQIRLGPDTPGPPEVDLAKVTDGNAQGLRVAGVTLRDGVPVSDLRIRINKMTLQGLPYIGEVGDTSTLAYALLIGGRTRLVGSFDVLAHAFGSDGAPAERTESYSSARGGEVPTIAGATLTVSAAGAIELSIDGADIVEAAAVRADGAAALAAAVVGPFVDIRDAVTEDANVDYLGVTAPSAATNAGGAGAAFVLLDPVANDSTYVTELKFGKGPGAGSISLRAYLLTGGQYVKQRAVMIPVEETAKAVITIGRDQASGFYLDAGEYLAVVPSFDLVFAGQVDHGSGVGFKLGAPDSFTGFDGTATPGNGNAPFQIRADTATRRIVIDKDELASDRAQVSVISSIVDTISKGAMTVLGPETLTAANNSGGQGGTLLHVEPRPADGNVTAFAMWPAEAAGGVVELRSFKKVGANRVLNRQRRYTVADDGSLFSVTEGGLDGLFVEAGEMVGLALISTSVRFGGPKTPQSVAYVASTDTSIPEATIAGAATGPGQSDFQFRIELVERTLGGGGVFAFGTSMVEGAGGTPWPSLLSTMIGRPVINRGVGGQRLPDVLARWGSYPMIVNPPDGVIPAEGSFDFFFPYLYARPQPITANNPGYTMTGVLGGVRGTISRLANSAWRFTRATPGAEVRIGTREQFVEDVRDGRYDGIALLEPASNSVGLQDTLGATAEQQFALVMDSTARAIDRLNSDRFMIFGPAMRQNEYPGSDAMIAGALLNGSQAYDLKLRIEDEMQARWSRQFVNHRGAVFEAFDPSSQADVDAHAANRMPPSKLADVIHYNTAGNIIWARIVAERGRALGFWA